MEPQSLPIQANCNLCGLEFDDSLKIIYHIRDKHNEVFLQLLQETTDPEMKKWYRSLVTAQ